jgi:hypothetical protein
MVKRPGSINAAKNRNVWVVAQTEQRTLKERCTARAIVEKSSKLVPARGIWAPFRSFSSQAGRVTLPEVLFGPNNASRALSLVGGAPSSVWRGA